MYDTLYTVSLIVVYYPSSLPLEQPVVGLHVILRVWEDSNRELARHIAPVVRLTASSDQTSSHTPNGGQQLSASDKGWLIVHLPVGATVGL
jgi:hypothetical protein